MCLIKESAEKSIKKTPKSPWRRHISEIAKPRLSRSVVTSARVNLNRYWSKFEEISSLKLPIVTFDIPTSNRHFKSQSTTDISDNLINEFRDLGK